MTAILLNKRIISSLKVICILGVATIIFFFYSWSESKKSNFIDITNNSSHKSNLKNQPKQNYEISIDNSTFEGLNKDLEPYKIRADTAIKIADNKYKLNKVAANYQTDGNDLLIQATEGVVDEGAKQVNLQDNVRILFNKLTFNTAQMQINLHNKDVLSNAPIEMFYKHSKIKADSFISEDNNNIIKFKGHVATRISIADFQSTNGQ